MDLLLLFDALFIGKDVEVAEPMLPERGNLQTHNSKNRDVGRPIVPNRMENGQKTGHPTDSPYLAAQRCGIAGCEHQFLRQWKPRQPVAAQVVFHLVVLPSVLFLP